MRRAEWLENLDNVSLASLRGWFLIDLRFFAMCNSSKWEEYKGKAGKQEGGHCQGGGQTGKQRRNGC